MDNFSENIKIAILGPVSAGKSTFFNSLCSNTCSDMKRKKTTMLPQIYNIVGDKNKIDSIEVIYNKNKESNEKILNLRESGNFVIEKDFTEIVHNIGSIPDFITLPDKNATYSILDMPGLNCGGDTLYYDYIKKISKSIDIYLLVFDINSGLNTTDEINIIQLVVEQIQKNANGYVHILINKCDDIQFQDDSIDLEDEELNELYERCVETINKQCQSILNKVTISPLCSSKLYIYRGVKNNISEIDENQLDNIIKNECGKQELKKLTTSAMKRKFISGLLKKNQTSLYDDWMNDTGYNMFIKNLNLIIQNYSTIIFYHINNDIQQLHQLLIDENYLDNIYTQINIINNRINKASKFTKDNKIPNYLINNLDIINNKVNIYIVNGVNSYSGSTIDLINSFLIKIEEYYLIIKKLFTENPIADSKNVLETKRINLLYESFENNFDYDIFIELVKKQILKDELFSKSISNVFNKSSSEFENIINFLEKYDIKYTNIVIDKFVEICIGNKKMSFNEFFNSLSIILNHKKDNLCLISKIITMFFKNEYSNTPQRFLVMDYWMILHSYNIKYSNSKIQLIFMNINNYIKHCIDNFKLYDFSHVLMDIKIDEYEDIIKSMKSIYDLLIKCYDKTNQTEQLIDFDNINSAKKTNENIILEKPVKNNKSTKKNVAPKLFDSDNSDSETKYDNYSDSDNSDTIYKKAVSNSSKRTKKIVKNG